MSKSREEDGEGGAYSGERSCSMAEYLNQNRRKKEVQRKTKRKTTGAPRCRRFSRGAEKGEV